MNTEFNSILGSKTRLSNQLNRLRSPTNTRAISRIRQENTTARGTPIKVKVDYQKVIRTRDSNNKLRKINNSIESLTDSFNEVSTVSNSFTQAKADLLAIKEIVEDTLNGNVETIEEQVAKQKDLNALVADLDGLSETATIGGRSVFNGNFNVSIPTGINEGVEISLTSNPDVVYDLTYEKKYNSSFEGFFDEFGEEVVSNSDYLVIGARNTSIFGSDGVYNPNSNNDNYLQYNKDNVDGSVEIYDKNSDKKVRLTSHNLRYALGLGFFQVQNEFANIQLGDSLAIEGNMLIIGASRIDGKDVNANQNDKEGKVLAIDLTKVNFDATNNFSLFQSGALKDLTNPNVSGEDHFGKAVAIDDGLIYASTYNGNSDSTISIFDTSGNLVNEIEAPTNTISFGYELSITDDKVIVSGYLENGNNGNTEVGALFVYDKSDLSLSPTVITSPLEDQGFQFGNSLDAAAYGNTIVVGEHRSGQGANVMLAGAVHLFNAKTGEYQKSLEPTSTMLSSGDQFGSAIAINDKFVAVAASGDDDAGDNAGAVYIFDRESGIELAKINNTGSEGFGTSIELEGDKIYIGSIRDSIIGDIGNYSDVLIEEAGAVYEYDLSSLELEVPEDSSEPNTVNPNINISASDLASANLNSIASGNIELAEATLAQVEGLLQGLETYENDLMSAQSKLEIKINVLTSEKETTIEINQLINDELKAAEQAQNSLGFKDNQFSREEETTSRQSSILTISQLYANIDANLDDKTATQLKTYINTFVYAQPATANKTSSNVLPDTVNDLLIGAI